MGIAFSKLRDAFQTGQASGEVQRHGVSPADPIPVGDQVSHSHILDKEVEDILNVQFSARRCALILSPFQMEDPQLANKMNRYAVRASQDSIKRHEAPISTSLFYYDTLNIHVRIEKDIGLQSMMSWIRHADVLAVYIDYGITQAMDLCIKIAKIKGCKIEYRTVGPV